MTARNILQAIKYLGTSEDSFMDIENYWKYRFSDQELIHCHHRREIDENKTRQQLIDEGLYYNVKAEDLIFLTAKEHATLHMTNKPHKKGETHPNFGRRFSLETRKRMSEAHKGEKNPNFGKHWYTDGKKTIKANECPVGFVEGRILGTENSSLISNIPKNVNDGKILGFAKTMPKIIKRQKTYSHQFKVIDPDGDEFNFSSIRGVANALECTPQAIYRALNYMKVPQVHGCKIVVITEG